MSQSHVSADLQVIVPQALEAARVEVLRRMTALRLPAIVPQHRLVVRDHDNGWETDVVTEETNGFNVDGVLYSLGDDSVRPRILGLRPQLQALAEYLAENTSLADQRYGWMQSEDWLATDVLMSRCVSPLAQHYLSSLPDLTTGDHQMANRLAVELADVAESDVVTHVHQLAVAGIRPTGRLKHGDVVVRPLSERERGAWIEQGGHSSDSTIPGSDLVPYTALRKFLPCALIQGETTRRVDELLDRSRLPYRLALAFFMLGFDLSGEGVVTHFDWPRWASLGWNHTPFPLGEKDHVDERELRQHEFSDVVDLAMKIPDFGPRETNAQEIALYRTLRGCGSGWNDSGFLDFAIALEAALLRGSAQELSYRFSLYGALFLHDVLDPRETYKKFKNIYEVRSKLVHGAAIQGGSRSRAYRDAPELATSVMRKAVESGWPNADNLNRLALAVSTES